MADTKLVTFESVSEAAEALTADGKRASTRNVINYLGGGSPNAVLGHLREWQAGRPQVTDNVIEVPEVTLNAIRSAMATAAEKAGKLAEGKAAELEETQEELRSEIHDLEKSTKAQADEIEEQANRISDLTADNAKLIDHVSQIKDAKREAEERLTAERNQERERAEKLAEDLAAAKSKLENLAGIERERDELKTELATARDTLTEAEKKTAVAESEAKAEARRAEEAAKREADTLARIERLETKLDAERSEATTLREALATAKEKDAQAQAAITKLTEETKARQKEIEVLTGKLADQKKTQGSK